MGRDACPRYNDNRGHCQRRMDPTISLPRTPVREFKEGRSLMERRNQVEIVPVWLQHARRLLYVLALLAFAKQLAREETDGESRASVRSDGGEAHHD
jgi:hypothetical protein